MNRVPSLSHHLVQMTSSRHAKKCAFLAPIQSCVTPRASIGIYEKDRRSGYKSNVKKTNKEIMKEGLGLMRGEFWKLKEEWKHNLNFDKFYPVQHGDYERLWKFDNKETIDNFTVTCDSNHHEGKSQAEFFVNEQKKGVFRGFLNTDVAKDGRVKRAGYANIKSQPNMKSFFRKHPYDWTDYTHLIFRCRGDGRPYQLILHMDRYFDVSWNDTYQYALFTRGGPYWQTAKIPFSKFFLASKGRIQDKQTPIDLDQILSLGITLGDRVKGPFQLEIDYIALLFDDHHSQQFAYEMYECNPSSLY
ncbi:hypothetical protein CAPTEDRAFT_164396 [Capitella teleta]|uniref:NADH:ubiquinone oxidoreductase intermediate-associated protein 30 domain-containing protein n=1 Tax=Capitella teleta TaxID=283909 RepID=R7V496_CAPTE|nr:hypothetical protein CAPTEDRAFT_164396 [Capitella teleta]|eukprot:ELU10625.1 hypothetical protein CAPTEDRAFT_164396 [Capitella teleta]